MEERQDYQSLFMKCMENVTKEKNRAKREEIFCLVKTTIEGIQLLEEVIGKEPNLAPFIVESIRGVDEEEKQKIYKKGFLNHVKSILRLIEILEKIREDFPDQVPSRIQELIKMGEEDKTMMCFIPFLLSED